MAGNIPEKALLVEGLTDNDLKFFRGDVCSVELTAE